MLPAEGAKSLLSTYRSLPHPSTRQALLGGRALTAFQQERTAAVRRRSKGFFPPKTASTEDVMPAGLTTRQKSQRPS